jgi:hypothetical protein
VKWTALVVAIAAHRHALQVRGHGRPEDGGLWAVLKHVDLDPARRRRPVCRSLNEADGFPLAP